MKGQMSQTLVAPAETFPMQTEYRRRGQPIRSVSEGIAVWNRRVPWVLLAAVAIPLSLPLIIGRLGFPIAVVLIALLAAILSNSVLGLRLTNVRLFGLVLLVLTAMNIHGLSSTEEFSELGRLSWFLAAGYIPYTLLMSEKILRTLSRQIPLLLFSLFTILMILWSLFSGQFAGVLQRQLFYLLVVLVAAEFLLHDKRTALALLYGLALAGLSAAVMLMVEYAFPDSLGLARSIERGGLRAASLFLNPNAAAFAISFSALVVAILTKLGFDRRWAILVFLPMSGALLLTFSRKGALWFILALIGLYMSYVVRRRYSLNRLFVGAAMALLTIMVIGYIFANTTLVQQQLDRSNLQIRVQQIGAMMIGDLDSLNEGLEASGRLSLFEISLRKIAISPILGYAVVDPDPVRSASELKPHNLFLLIWEQYGIFALLLFCGMLLVALLRLVNIRSAFKVWGFLLMAHLLVHMMAAHTLLHNRYYAIPMALLLVYSQIPLFKQR